MLILLTAKYCSIGTASQTCTTVPSCKGEVLEGNLPTSLIPRPYWVSGGWTTYRHAEDAPSSCKSREKPAKEEEGKKALVVFTEKPGVCHHQPTRNGGNTPNYEGRLATKFLCSRICKQSSKDSTQGEKCLKNKIRKLINHIISYH